jgi:hypothetical protein
LKIGLKSQRGASIWIAAHRRLSSVVWSFDCIAMVSDDGDNVLRRERCRPRKDILTATRRACGSRCDGRVLPGSYSGSRYGVR